MASIHQTRPWRKDTGCTPESVYLSRRAFLTSAARSVAVVSLGAAGGCADSTGSGSSGERFVDPELGATLHPKPSRTFVHGERNSNYTVDRPMTDESVAGAYNNFYEFSESKAAVWRLARAFKPRPWTVEIAGEVAHPRTIDFDDLVKKMPIEERVYRMRCVEAWSMTVPWTGFAFKALHDWIQPTSKARFVRMLTFHRPDQARGQRSPTPWRWPYYEAITLEEAANELTFIATGIYGHALPNQHGAPLRLVVPWKYGYKSIKSIVKIEFTEYQPSTFWNDAIPKEYSFWSNVDPAKPHPRWSQATERVLGSDHRVPTLPYHGYGEFVHHMYKGQPSAAL